MSSRREVLIRILALLQRKTLIKPKKSHIKMLKTALFDCAINEKCCSVDGGRGICPLLSSPPWGIWQLKSPHPREFVMQGKKKKKKKRLGAAGIDWCIILKSVWRARVLLQAMFMNDWKQTAKRLKLQETTNNQ